eukprot:COSAG01_NODE_32206_length_584_cov_9.657732_1_plen_65_part_00
MATGDATDVEDDGEATDVEDVVEPEPFSNIPTQPFTGPFGDEEDDDYMYLYGSGLGMVDNLVQR